MCSVFLKPHGAILFYFPSVDIATLTWDPVYILPLFCWDLVYPCGDCVEKLVWGAVVDLEACLLENVMQFVTYM